MCLHFSVNPDAVRGMEVSAAANRMATHFAGMVGPALLAAARTAHPAIPAVAVIPEMDLRMAHDQHQAMVEVATGPEALGRHKTPAVPARYPAPTPDIF